MIKVKGNYKNGHKDLSCRMCKTDEETQTHILEECPIMHQNNDLKVPKKHLFSEDTGTLRVTADALEKLMEKLNEVVY